MEITRQGSADRQLIQRYKSGFKVSDVSFTGPVIVTTAATIAWPVTTFAQLTIDDFAPLLAEAPWDVCLLGCGDRTEFVPPDLRAALKAKGIPVDAMGTGSACRTFNVLTAEGRHVVAALLPL